MDMSDEKKNARKAYLDMLQSTADSRARNAICGETFVFVAFEKSNSLHSESSVTDPGGMSILSFNPMVVASSAEQILRCPRLKSCQ